ncbi:hypothetical protein [Neisseria leonii]|uniref:hypothetical protein n=1 Tax=Neisseria leonii TaxID=2995413 RepID=UPI00237A2F48|nr:hypothetical protein [Neisseria sp. 3986]MDD9326291.1 hypothetical protein [Neisseria sp. 3986]
MTNLCSKDNFAGGIAKNDSGRDCADRDNSFSGTGRSDSAPDKSHDRNGVQNIHLTETKITYGKIQNIELAPVSVSAGRPFRLIYDGKSGNRPDADALNATGTAAPNHAPPPRPHLLP